MAGKHAEIEEKLKSCKHCKKKVVTSLDCEICSSSFHRSCAFQAKVDDQSEKINCCGADAKSEAKSSKKEIIDEKMDENRIKHIIGGLFNDFLNPFKKGLERDMKELQKSVQHMSDSFDEQKVTFDKALAEIKTIKQENNDIKQRLRVVETKLEEMEQRDKANNIVIMGVPKQSEPNTCRIVEKIARTLQVPLQDCDIRESFRLNKQEGGPILLRLGSYEKKKEFLMKIRQSKGTTVKKCGLQGNDSKIYLNDDLTVQKRSLLKKAKEIRDAKGYKAVFCLNGNFFLKKKEQRTYKDIV